MDVETFNELKRAKQGKAFDEMWEAHKKFGRVPSGALGQSYAAFLIGQEIALIRRTYGDGSEEHFAVEKDTAESALNCSIDDMRYWCKEEGITYGDWQECQAYLAAADALKRTVEETREWRREQTRS